MDGCRNLHPVAAVAVVGEVAAAAVAALLACKYKIIVSCINIS